MVNMVEIEKEKIEELKKISPEERIKKLEALATTKKSELEEELKKIEELKNKSISEAIDSAKINEEKEIEELRNKENKFKKQKLEETIEKEQKNFSEENKDSNINYNLIEEILKKDKPNFYEITKPEIYKTVVDIYDKAKNFDLTKEEKQFISSVNESTERFMQNEIYKKQDQENKNYLSRTKTFIDKLLGM